MQLNAATLRLQDWFIARALPLWARAGADPSGAFYESLTLAGEGLPGRRRVRVQCRQIHTFTQAALRGWFPQGEAIGARGFDRLIETSVPGDGARGCVHSLNDDGSVDQRLRDLYDQAFLLLACAARIGAANDPRALTIARKTLAFLDREFASPYGGFRENDRGGHPRRQNPHMHLFEALIALAAATADDRILDRARSIDALFRAKFFDAKAGALREYFNDDLSLIDKTSDRLEPGHMAEWVALFDRFERAAGENRDGVRRALYQGAMGRCIPGEPFLPNAARLGAAPQRASRRLWPQTELLRAATIMGDDAAAASLIAGIFKTYLDTPVVGLWYDEFDAAGAMTAKAVPASILYHLFEAVGAAADARQNSAA